MRDNVSLLLGNIFVFAKQVGCKKANPAARYKRNASYKLLSFPRNNFVSLLFESCKEIEIVKFKRYVHILYPKATTLKCFRFCKSCVDFIASRFSSKLWKVTLWKCLDVKSIEEHPPKQSLGPFSSTYRHAKPRSPNMNSRSKSRHSTSVALSRIEPTFLNREARSLLIYDLAILWISSRESESRWYGGCAPVVGETYNAPVSPTLDRRGDPSSHQLGVSSSILLTRPSMCLSRLQSPSRLWAHHMIVSLTESKETRYSCAFQNFHGIAIHDDQYEVFSRHPSAPGRLAGFVRTTIGVSNCENRILEFMLASITLNIVANVFHKFEDDTHMRIDRPGLLRRTVSVGGGLSTRKYNRRSCTVNQASWNIIINNKIAYYFLHIGQYVDHHDVVIDVTGSIRNYLIDYHECIYLQKMYIRWIICEPEMNQRLRSYAGVVIVGIS
ncbi:hypothetical protein G5I_11769 [Acromyrmex echinatior]|uniref:Uncharacterized protein n=1 Tax=Acromyrmex echinatior TaxID=103372 RepID=F4X0J0_ACREC|nr:hypothetical protein G5I_11769 [Acromyrmex echinatior]